MEYRNKHKYPCIKIKHKVMDNKEKQKNSNRIKNKKIQHISLPNFQRQLQKEHIISLQINRPSPNLNKIKPTKILLPNHRLKPTISLQLARTRKARYNTISRKSYNNRRRNSNKKVHKLLTKTRLKKPKRNKQRETI